jgi:hypothetical protein
VGDLFDNSNSQYHVLVFVGQGELPLCALLKSHAKNTLIQKVLIFLYAWKHYPTDAKFTFSVEPFPSTELFCFYNSVGPEAPCQRVCLTKNDFTLTSCFPPMQMLSIPQKLLSELVTYLLRPVDEMF